MTDNKTKDDTEVEEQLTEEDSSGQYVTFFLNEEAFAFSMNDVREIVRVPQSVAVPLTSSALEGLSNLRGSVLPVLDLRRLLDIEERRAL